MAENAQKLDSPPQQVIDHVLNENHIRLFEPPILEEPIKITRQLYNTQDLQLHLAKDTLLDTSTHSIRLQAYTSYMAAPQKKKSSPSIVDDS